MNTERPAAEQPRPKKTTDFTDFTDGKNRLSLSVKSVKSVVKNLCFSMSICGFCFCHFVLLNAAYGNLQIRHDRAIVMPLKRRLNSTPPTGSCFRGNCGGRREFPRGKN